MPTVLQASISSVPAGAVTFLPSTVMLLALVSHVLTCVSRLVPLDMPAVLDLFDLRRVPFGMSG